MQPSLCTEWKQWVKQFFDSLHGHQSSVLALFVYGAIQATSIVVQRVAEALRHECQVKVPSIERRLQRFLANEKVQVTPLWSHFLQEVLPHWKGQAVYLILDEVWMNDDAKVIYFGLLQKRRTLPLAWTVVPQPKAEDDPCLAEATRELALWLALYLQACECTLIADRGFGCHWMVQLCQQMRWHYLLRVKGESHCQRWKHGRLQMAGSLSQTLLREGQQWFGKARVWQEPAIETQVSAIWKRGHEEPWFLISDQPASYARVKEYRWRMRVEATFQDMKSRGWDWEDSHVKDPAHLDRLLLVLFLAFWWLTHLAASCLHNGRRDRYDRHDRRDKGILRLGRLYLQDIERTGSTNHFRECLPLVRRANGWRFCLRF